MKKNNLRKIELLAPAKDAEIAIEAIKHGADAVYMGPASHGARAMAGNSTADIAKVVAFAHQFGARVYATVNTLVYDEELGEVERLITDLYNAGVDALIVQDMSVLRMNIPPIALHSSTQCDLRTPEKARFLTAMGFSQLVMARELSLNEIAAIHEALPDMPLECFAHGALCVSYSGRCQVSQCLKGRSANRGECAQICRLPYDLEDAEGHQLMQGKYLLSLRDLNASDYIEALMEAGVSSFKIEGRLKDVGYVKNVVAYYRRAIDAVIAKHPEQYCRASVGQSDFTFEPDLKKSFNRSFTSYFIDERYPNNGHSIASINTPKSIGEPIGTVLFAKNRTLRLRGGAKIANGDGLSYFDQEGKWVGFRVNKVEGNDLVLKDSVAIQVGTPVYRTYDKMFDDVLSKESAKRSIRVDAALRWTNGQLVLDMNDERGNSVTHAVECASLDDAKSDQTDRQLQALGKLGGTIYVLRHAEVMGDKFIPSSVLAQLRRDTVALLDRAQAMTLPRPKRVAEDKEAVCFATQLTYADNVANHVAAELFRSHGVTEIEPALEVEKPQGNPVVMHTRYCIRRELGACLKDGGAKKLPADLYLRYGGTQLKINCDCKRCEMQLTIE